LEDLYCKQSNFVKSDKTFVDTIMVGSNRQVRDKLQPESSPFKTFWMPDIEGLTPRF